MLKKGGEAELGLGLVAPLVPVSRIAGKQVEGPVIALQVDACYLICI